MNSLNIGEKVLGSQSRLQFEEIDRKGDQIIIKSTNPTKSKQILFCECVLRLCEKENKNVDRQGSTFSFVMDIKLWRIEISD
jgi:hypothetical protein